MADVEKKIIIDIETNAQQATQKMDGLKGAVSGVDKATGGLLSSLKKLVTNPYIAIIGAIVAVFMKLRDAIKSSDNAGTAFARLGATLKAVWQPVERLFIGIAEALGDAANAAADFMKSILPAKLKEDAERLDDIVVATDKLQDAEREYAVKHAEREAEISRLRADAADKEHFTIEQRIGFMQRAMQQEKADLQQRKSIADEKIRIFRLETKDVISLSDEQKDTLNQLLIEKQNADREYSDSQRRLNKTLKPLMDDLIEQATDLTTNWQETAAAIKEVVEESEKLSGKGVEEYTQDVEALQGEFRKTVMMGISAFRLPEEMELSVHKAFNQMMVDAQDLSENGVVKLKEDFEAIKSQLNPLVFGGLIEQIGNFVEGFENRVKSINDAANKAVNDAYQKRLKAAKETTKSAGEDITKIQRDTLKIQLETQEEWLKNNEGFIAEINKENLRYAKEDLTLNNQISDLMAKKAKATSQELKNVYQEQIEALFAKGEAMAAVHLKNIDKIVEQERQKIKDTDFATLIDPEDLADAEEFLNKRKELLDKYKPQLTDEQSLENDLSQLADALDKELITEEEYHTMSLQRQKEYDDKKKQEAEETAQQIAQSSSDILSSFASVAGSIADHYHQKYEEIVNGKDELSQEEAERAIAALEREKEATKAQLILQQAVAIGNAIVAATSAASMSGPAAAFVYAATAASITAGLISSFIAANDAMKGIDEQIAAVKAKATGYATGGYIEGAGTATSDSIPARLSNGESVINARSTARFYDLLSAINQAGGGVAFPNAMSVPQLNFANGGVAQSYENTYKMIESAVAGIQPVVSVKEITKVQNRLKTKEII